VIHSIQKSTLMITTNIAYIHGLETRMLAKMLLMTAILFHQLYWSFYKCNNSFLPLCGNSSLLQVQTNNLWISQTNDQILSENNAQILSEMIQAGSKTSHSDIHIVISVRSN
jgi:hypothetical protein